MSRIESLEQATASISVLLQTLSSSPPLWPSCRPVRVYLDNRLEPRTPSSASSPPPAGRGSAVKAFLDTNMYCPRPDIENTYIESLWTAFTEKYIQFSDEILDHVIRSPELKRLPRGFTQKVAQQTVTRRRDPRPGGQGPPGRGFGSYRRGSREAWRARSG
jgi:hypothetical protein